MTEQELDVIRVAARETVHNTDLKSWAWRCAVCNAAVEIIKQETGCDETAAKMLFAAWTMENAAVLHRDAVAAWRETMDRHYPLAMRITDAAEEQLKQMKEGEDWKPGEATG